jgi:UPF0042 nucleotide-binding protein
MVIDNVENMLNAIIPSYIEQGKHRLMVCFGCTGGQHRSVSAALELFSRMQGKYNAAILHRDASIEKQDMQPRT